MRLDALDVLIVSNPPPGFGGRYFTFVKVTTDTGLVGWGEVYAAAVGPVAMAAVIRDVFARHMAGEDPARVELMFRRAYSAGFTQRPDPTVMGAFSGLEIACWDILGKHYGVPCHRLLGGRLHERLRAYTYLYPTAAQDPATFYGSPAQSAEAARAWADAGFTAIKFDPAGPYTVMGGHMPTMDDIERSAAFCAEIRAAVGTRADLLFGTHGQFTAGGAIRLAHAIAPHCPLWFEEPVPPDDVEAMAQVAAASPVPVATGERLSTRAEFAPLLARRAVSIVQPALGRVGGLWEARKLAALAESFGAQVAPHLYAGPVEWAANVHLGAVLPNVLIAESIGTGDGLHAELTDGAIRVVDGYIPVPDAPGLGIEIDESVARAHPYEGERLHLEMQPRAHLPGSDLFAGG